MAVGRLQLVVEPAQLVAHPVEVGGQRAQLVAVADGDVTRKVAGRDLAQPIVHPLDGLDQRPRDRVAVDEGQPDAADREADHDPP